MITSCSDAVPKTRMKKPVTNEATGVWSLPDECDHSVAFFFSESIASNNCNEHSIGASACFVTASIQHIACIIKFGNPTFPI